MSIVALAGSAKEIVCGIFWTGNDLLTGLAAAYRSLPAWLAMMVQVPPLMAVALLPETVQTPGVSEVNDTASFDVADADRAIR